MNTSAFSEKARWVWPKLMYNTQNAYSGFRHDFKMTSLPGAAPLLITADQSYRLWVNGRYVCRGPLRGHQANWYYDTVELLSFLRKGKNWLAVEAYNPGISHFSYTYRDNAGFLCSAQWDNGTEIVSGIEGWTVFRNTASNANTGRLSIQMGFQEELDLRADDRSWITRESGYTLPPPADWVEIDAIPQGSLPWTHLAPRPTAMLTEKYLPAAELLACGTGSCSPNYSGLPFPDNNFIRDFACGELPTIRYQEELPEAVRTEKALKFTLPANPAGRYTAVLLDVGRLEWLPGTAEFEAETGDNDAVLDFAFLHHLTGNKICYLDLPNQGCLVASGARFHLRRGHNEASCYQITGTRYTAVIIRGNTAPAVITFRFRSAVSGLDDRGHFQCSDRVFNEIYALSRHTQQCCALDAFVDTPWREQSQWWGDARIQAKNVYFLTGGTALLRQGIHSISGQPGPEGLLFANAPTTDNGPVLPDFCLTWVQTLYDLYFYTGETGFLRQYKSRVKKIFGYFEHHKGPDGLIRYDNRFWLFEDWSTLPKRNKPAFLNLLYHYTRIHYQKLLEAAGFTGEAAALQQELCRERERLVQAYFLPDQGLFAPEIGENGEPDGTPSVHDQVLAILCDLCPEQHSSLIRKRLLPCLQGKAIPGAALPSSFWAAYLLQAARQCGLVSEALAYLKRGWEPMISTGTAWEEFPSEHLTSISVCHAWSGHPVYQLPELFFGLKQLAPQWKQLSLEPGFQTAEASLALPVPGGTLKCSWNEQEFVLELPAGIHAGVRLPAETLELDGPCRLKLGCERLSAADGVRSRR